MFQSRQIAGVFQTRIRGMMCFGFMQVRKPMAMRPGPPFPFPDLPQYLFCEFYDEDSLEILLAKWNHCVVSDALSKSQDHLSENFSALKEVYMVRAGQAQYPRSDAISCPEWDTVQP